MEHGIRLRLTDFAPASALGERLRAGVLDALLGVGVPSEEELAWDDLAFRRRLLDACGFGAADALALAVRPEIDLQEPLALVRGGCDPTTAARILL
jgi:hypothetical protein